MFIVRWVVKHKLGTPIFTEESAYTSLDATVEAAQERLYCMRLKFIHSFAA
jgi:hypothetical protein